MKFIRTYIAVPTSKKKDLKKLVECPITFNRIVGKKTVKNVPVKEK